MKKFSLALAALIGLTILAPTTAQAGHNTRVSVDHHGYTVYSEYRFVGRDCHGCPVYRWVVVRREAPCDNGYGDSYGGDRYDGGYGGHSYGGHRGGYSGGRGSAFSLHWSRESAIACGRRDHS